MENQLNLLSENYGLKIEGKTAYGRIGGIFYNVIIVNFGTFAVITAFVSGDIDSAAVKEYLKKNKRRFKLGQWEIGEKSVSVQLGSATFVKADKIHEFVADFSGFLTGAGYRSGCAMCAKDENLGYTLQNGQILEICNSCHIAFESRMDEEKQTRVETGSYAKGVAGAVIGGILGIIPWALFGALGYIAAASGFLMAFLSLKGYRLFKGKIGKGMVPIIIAVLIVFTYAAIIVNQTIADYGAYPGDKSGVSIPALFVSELAAPFSSRDIIVGDYLLTPDTRAAWGQIAMGWFFAGLGSFFFLRDVFRISSGKDLEFKRIGKDGGRGPDAPLSQ